MSSSLRDCQAWRNENLALSTTSNDAAKLFDDVINQYVTWTENVQYNGIEGTLKKMHEFDTNFVMGDVLSLGLELMGTGRPVRLDKELAEDVSNLDLQLKTNTSITDREKLHCKGVLQFARGEYNSACEIWEEIMQSHPNDILAIKFAHDAYFYLGNSIMIRDSVGRILPHWKASNSLYGYLQGMYAFGLEETNLYVLAERYATEALERNPTDCWATHARAHCFEMTGRFEKGIEFMKSTENNWTQCKMLACHNYWHWALYYIEKGDYERALGIYDQQVNESVTTSGVPLDIVDAASLLQRFELQGVDVANRWQNIHDTCRPHVDDHLMVFNDFHYIMSYIGCKGNKGDIVEKYMSSLMDFCSTERHYSRNVFNDIGIDLCNGLIAYSEQRYDDAVQLWYPLKLDVVRMGGSHAQRDVFQQLLISTCIQSNSKKSLNLGRALINERKLLRENSPLTDRMMDRLLSRHE